MRYPMATSSGGSSVHAVVVVARVPGVRVHDPAGRFVAGPARPGQMFWLWWKAQEPVDLHRVASSLEGPDLSRRSFLSRRLHRTTVDHGCEVKDLYFNLPHRPWRRDLPLRTPAVALATVTFAYVTRQGRSVVCSGM